MATYINDKTKRSVLSRQQGLCACCGMRFIELDLSGLRLNFHHVCPAQLGGSGDAENVVGVCRGAFIGTDEISCHYRVHLNGHYRSGVVAPPSYFRFSHGLSSVAHAHWVARMEG